MQDTSPLVTIYEIINCVGLLATTFCLLDDKSNDNEVNAICIRRV